MSEFGHHHAIGRGLCVDGWGSGPFVIVAGGKSFRFGDSDRFGPYLANRHGDPVANPYPGERSPSWRAHRIWVRQGRRIADDNTCLWDEPKAEKLWRLSGRTAVVIEPGEEDGTAIEASDEEIAAWRARHP